MFVALVRILVDGYSLLHNWPELAPGKPRHSASARDELIHILTRYHDAVGTPITLFFDGAGAPPGVAKHEASPHVEVLFSKAGQTADQLIERAAHRFKPDVVLCDIGLPGLDGYQVARLLRQDQELSGVCLVALSGYGQDADRRRLDDRVRVTPAEGSEIRRI